MMDNRDKFITANDVLVGIKTFKECYRENENVFSPELVEFAYTVLNMVEEFVNKTPPADVEKVMHGRWKKLPYHPYRCSRCDEIAPLDQSGEFHYTSNYCPNCGANMDGDGNG